MKRRKIKAADAFCGCGGATTGFEQKAEELGLDHVSVAVNHWDIAINTMSQNHPKVKAVRADMMTLIPSDVLNGQLDFFWASPSCTYHMGMFGVGKEYTDREFNAALAKYPQQIIATHCADWWAARVTEEGVFAVTGEEQDKKGTAR